MNVHDLPMVLFTVFTQMAVGTFLVIGVIQLATFRRSDRAAVDRVVDPILYAIGPTLVFGLIVSMLHMNDLTNTFDVLRHWNSSWLTREIMFGMAFGAVGFVFAVMSWYRRGSRTLRHAVAYVTALLGVGLVWSQSMVYYSLVAVPAWHTWEVPVFFFGTSVLLGVLAVAGAMMVTTMVRARRSQTPKAGGRSGRTNKADESGGSSGGGPTVQVRERIREINAPTTDAEWTLTAWLLKGLAATGAATCVAILVVYPLYLSQLGQGDAAAQASLEEISGTMLWVRLALLGVTAVILGVFVYRMAETTPLAQVRSLAALVLFCLLLTLTSELLGRALHYAANVRVGI